MCSAVKIGFRISYQGTIVEATVVQKLNQGSFPKTGCNRFRGSFFVTFLWPIPNAFGGEAKK